VKINVNYERAGGSLGAAAAAAGHAAGEAAAGAGLDHLVAVRRERGGGERRLHLGRGELLALPRPHGHAAAEGDGQEESEAGGERRGDHARTIALRAALVSALALAACSTASGGNDLGPPPDDCSVDRDRPGDPAGDQTVATAVPTRIGATTWTEYVAPLQLCPAGDRDVFSVDLSFITTPLWLDVRVSVGAGQAAPTVEVLDAAMAVMRTAALETGGTQVAHLDGLAAGTLYVQVSGEAPTLYSLELLVGQPGAGGDMDDDIDEGVDEDIDDDIDEGVDEDIDEDIDEGVDEG
jgi:hypothetical protein